MPAIIHRPKPQVSAAPPDLGKHLHNNFEYVEKPLCFADDLQRTIQLASFPIEIF
jgi:hypothetical protein